MVKRGLAVLLSAVLLAPSAVLAQSKAGIVTTLEGNVTARRVALTTPVPLKFKDEVFLQDTVTTGDQSLARMLLGGKAVVTVRERSVLTITEVPGKSTIDLESGKFALAVAREKMRPGEEILIRTPNAIAGVRGTVVVTEVNRQTAQLGRGASGVLTNFYVLRGSIVAQPLDPGTRQPQGTPLQIGTLQAYSGAGSAAPRVAPVAPEQIGQITSGLQPSGPKGGGDAGKEQAKSQALQTAVVLLAALNGGADTQVATASAPPPPSSPSSQPNTPPIVALDSEIEQAQALAAENLVLQSFSEFLSALFGLNVTLTNTAAARFATGFTGSSTAALLSLSGAAIVQTGDDVSFVEVLNGANVSLAGPLASITNSALLTSGKLLEVRGTLKSAATSSLIALEGSHVLTGKALLSIDGGVVDLAGGLLSDLNSTITSADEFVRMQNAATLKSTGSDALVRLNGTAVGGSAALRMTNASMHLAGPLVSATSITGAGVGNGHDAPALFLLDASSITSTGSGPLIAFASSNATPEGNFLRLASASRITLAGPLLSAAGGSFGSGLANAVRAFITVLDGSVVTSTTTTPLISFNSATLDTQGPVVNVRRSPSTSLPSTLSLAGPLFSATHTAINTTSLGFASTFGTVGNCCSTFSVEQGGVLSSTTSLPLITLGNASVTTADAQSGASFFLINDTVNGFPSTELVAPSTVSLAGPLLSATGSTITPLFSLLGITRSSLSSTTSSPLIELITSTVKTGGTDISGNATFGRLLSLSSTSSPFGSPASAASVSLAGPFLSATSSQVSGSQLMAIFGGAAFSSTTTNPLIALNGTSLKLTSVTVGELTDHGDVVKVGGQGGTSGAAFATMNLQGPLLTAASGSALDTSGALTFVFAGGQIVESHPSSPFVSINGGTHKIATDGGNALFRLFGRTGATTNENVSTPGLNTSSSSLTLGTDEPLKRSGTGAFLEVSNASVTTNNAGSGGSGVVLDHALLGASAPLLQLKNSASLTLASDAINLTAQAKLTAIGPLVKLDGSTLTINNGHGLLVSNGSFLNVTGDLFSLANASTLNITGGGALFIGGGSVVKIGGGLVNFGGSGGNAINISNGFTPTAGCSTQCGPFGSNSTLQNGASFGNVSISSNAIKNSGLGSFSVTGSAIILDGSTSKVIISGN